jgi:hypothetical protein
LDFKILDLKGFWRIFYTILYLAIFILQLYLIFHALPEYVKLYRDCDRKILCEYGSLPEQVCYGFEWGKYYKPNFPLKNSFPNISKSLDITINISE